MGHSDIKFWFSGNAHTGKPWFTWCILSFKKTADTIFKLSFLISVIERYSFFVGQPNHSLLCNESENGKCTLITHELEMLERNWFRISSPLKGSSIEKSE